MTSNVPYKGQHTAKLPSPKVWGQFPVKQASCMVGGEYRVADFRDAIGALATPDATVISGDVRLASSAAADTDIKRSLGDGSPVLDWTPADGEDLVVGPQIVFDIGAGRPWAYEARVAIVTAVKHSMFAGLATLAGNTSITTYDAYTAAYILADGGAQYGDRGLIGFHKHETLATIFASIKDRGTADNAGYQINGTSAAIESGATISAVKTLVDATFVKLGMYSDGRVIRWFVDNAEVASLEMGHGELPSGGYESSMVPVLVLNASHATLAQVSWVACGYVS